MRIYLGTLLLGAAMLAPVAVQAQDRDRDRERAKRYYDRDHKDYHQWNEGENRAYKRFLEERHEDHRDFNRENKERQRAYWRWRHEHSDNVLFPR